MLQPFCCSPHSPWFLGLAATLASLPSLNSWGQCLSHICSIHSSLLSSSLLSSVPASYLIHPLHAYYLDYTISKPYDHITGTHTNEWTIASTLEISSCSPSPFGLPLPGLPLFWLPSHSIDDSSWYWVTCKWAHLGHHHVLITVCFFPTNIMKVSGV